MQCYCGAGEDHLPFLHREFSDKREVRLFLFWESVVQAEKMLRRINAGALLMNEKEEPFIAECIIRIMDIMRREEEFYIQEASGLLMALLAGIARLNRTPEQ